MAEKNPNKTNTPKEDNSSDEETTPRQYRTSYEEREYGTIRGSAAATSAALSHTRAQTNPTVPRGPEKQTRVKKLPKDKARNKETQTKKEDE